MTTSYTMTIDGKPVGSNDELDIVNPATEERVGSAPVCSADQLDEAIAAAQRAFPAWAADDEARTQALAACGAALLGCAPQLAEILTAELGKPTPLAVEEAQVAGYIFHGYAAMPLEPDTVAVEPSRVEIHRRALGVVSIIAPWNWPLGLAMWHVAPALRAGNTVVLKPSPLAPLSLLRLGTELAKHLPPGVLNVVGGGEAIGERMVTHPAVRKVGFTGSVPTGLAIAASAAADLKRVTLEMGGNDAAIVLDDADIEKIAEPLFWGIYLHNGQICASIKRIYVAESRYEALVNALVERAGRTRIGDPRAKDTELGPLGNRRQLERIESMVREAVGAGATLACGGKRLDQKGFFYPPTVVTDVDETSRLVNEEQFGPVIPVMKVADDAEAIRRANDTSFGLGGSVWGTDLKRARTVAMQLECGNVWVNQHFAVDATAPFGGWKHSGQGRVNARFGLDDYTELQTVSVAGG